EDGLQRANAADGTDLLAHLVDDAHAAESDHGDDFELAADLGSGRENTGDRHTRSVDQSLAQRTAMTVALSFPPAAIAAPMRVRQSCSRSVPWAAHSDWIVSSEIIPDSPSLQSR